MYCLTSFGNDLDTLELYDIDKGVFCKLPSLNFLYDNNDICGRCEVLGRDDYVYHVVDKSLIYLLDRGKYMKAVLAGIMPALTKDELLEDTMEVYNYNPILCYLDIYDSKVKELSLNTIYSNYMYRYFNVNVGYICLSDDYHDIIALKSCNIKLHTDYMVRSLVLYQGSWKIAVKVNNEEVLLVDIFTFETNIMCLDKFLKDIDFERFFDRGRF